MVKRRKGVAMSSMSMFELLSERNVMPAKSKQNLTQIKTPKPNEIQSKTHQVNLADMFTLPNGNVLKNRIVKSALNEELADRRTRQPTEDYLQLYKVWSNSGAAVLISGNMMVDRRYTTEVRNVVLDEKTDEAVFRRLVETAQEHGSQFWVQLNHPGRQMPMLNGWQPIAPSEVAMKKGLVLIYKKPKAMTESDIQQVIKKFANSAKLAKTFGCSGVQIHAAHGYLINQFLSPASNQRKDKWGGSLENRARFLLEIYHAIRAEVGVDFTISVKLNSADYMQGGFDQEDSIQIAQMLDLAGIDLLEISGGTYENPMMVDAKASTQQREAYFMDYAEQVRQLIQTPIMLTGGFESHAGMQMALNQNAADLIGLGRHFALNPYVAEQILADPQWHQKIAKQSTGFAKLDHFMILNISWYEQQLSHITQYQKANPKLSPWKSILLTAQSLGLNSLLKLKRSG